MLRIDSGGAGFAGITRLLRAKTQVAVKAHVNLKRDGLKPGASRPIVWVGGDGGHSQQAGVIRTRRGLRWGTWRITPAGKRVDVAVSRKTRVHKGTWQTVTFTSNWNGRARSALSTGTLPITGSPSSKLAGVRANRVTLALGRASKAAGKSVLLVRRATLTTRAARGAGSGGRNSRSPGRAEALRRAGALRSPFAFNERIPAGTPSDARSDAIIAQLTENASQANISLSSGGEVPPVYVARPTDPFFSVSVGGGHAVPGPRRRAGGRRLRLAAGDPRPAPPRLRPADRAEAVAGVGRLQPLRERRGAVHYNNDGAILNPNGTPSHSIPFEGSGTGSGLSILAGLIRPDEVRLGRINHALRFTYSASDFSNRFGRRPSSPTSPTGPRPATRRRRWTWGCACNSTPR